MTESVLRGMPPSESSLRELVIGLLPQGFARIVQPIASTDEGRLSLQST